MPVGTEADQEVDFKEVSEEQALSILKVGPAAAAAARRWHCPAATGGMQSTFCTACLCTSRLGGWGGRQGGAPCVVACCWSPGPFAGEGAGAAAAWRNALAEPHWALQSCHACNTLHMHFGSAAPWPSAPEHVAYGGTWHAHGLLRCRHNPAVILEHAASPLSASCLASIALLRLASRSCKPPAVVYYS